MRSSLSAPCVRQVKLVLALLLARPVAGQSTVGARWFVGGDAPQDFQIAVDTDVAHSGRASLRVSADDEPSGFAGVSTSVSAKPYANQRVRVSAYLRTASLAGQGAALWARSDADGKRVAFTTTQGRSYLGGTMEWTPVLVELAVPANASTILVGALSTGRGTMWVDDVRLEIVPSGGESRTAGRVLGFEAPDVLIAPPASAAMATLQRSPREAPRPLTVLGLDNLLAFARLTGYVRFFHPGDSALTTSWDEFTVRGMRVVERAPTADSLAATLRGLFAPVAPTMVVYRTGDRAPIARAPDTGSAVVFWEHCGYGVPAGALGGVPNSVYHSIRRRVAAPNGVAPASVPAQRCLAAHAVPVPDPMRPFIADLGGRVSVALPMALFTAASDADSLWRPRPASERFSLDDRATRLADVALLWTVPQHFYPYFDVVHTDWTAALRRAFTKAAVDNGDTSFDTTLQRLVAALRDGHGNVYRRGVVLASPDVALGWVEERVVVLAVGDSARAAGVRAGDELRAVDGRPVAEALRDAEERTSGATPQWVRHAALRKLTLGPPGSVAVLRLQDPLARGAAPRDVRLPRLATALPAEPRPAKVAELRPGIFYVDLSRVTDTDVSAALPRLASAQGVVFDMRGYPSQVNTPAVLEHLADSVIHSARFQVPLVTQPDHAKMIFAGEGWTIDPGPPRLRGRIAFMTGSGAISYAESTMGVVEENRLADIVGEATAGTNGNVNPFALPGGYVVTWTGMRVQKRDGTPHHGVGIRPTILATPTLRGIRLGRDEVLDRALEVVSAPTR